MANSSARNFRAFTLKSEQPLKFISIEVGVLAHSESEDEIPLAQIPKYKARINTAIQFSRVSDKIISDLKLTAQEKNGEMIYPIEICLPNAIRIKGVPARKLSEQSEPQDDCVIGMDVLSCGDVSLSFKDKKTMFSFRIPSLGAEDFVQTHRRLHKGKMVTTSAARNGPCPCGSGKKYKNCCGRIF